MRLIDADALVKDLRQMAKFQDPYKCSTILGVCSTIEARKTIDAAPVVHARWETYTYSNRVDTYGNPDTCAECSNCGGKWSYEQEAKRLFRYCPYCGAKMDGGAEA